MITKIELQNFGPLEKIEWPKLSNINLIIGGNGSGKTFLLKSLYCAMRTLEDYKRGNNQQSAPAILAEKLYWTFQPDKIGDLVSKGAGNLSFRINIDTKEFNYSFGKDTTKLISLIENHVPPRASNSVFLPAKEILTLHNVILRSRETDQIFGFDDTYYDLTKALRQQGKKGKNFATFARSRQDLEDIIGGRIEYDETVSKWQFRHGKHRFPVGVTAEGVKKIAILDTLLGNRYLDENSIIFIDEIESALHPAAITKLLDIVVLLSRQGIQFFISSHSYFVVKKLFLAAQEKEISVPVISFINKAWQSEDLKDGMPDNPIISESIRLYQEEVNLSFR